MKEGDWSARSPDLDPIRHMSGELELRDRSDQSWSSLMLLWLNPEQISAARL